jgi:hypothetical protein
MKEKLDSSPWSDDFAVVSAAFATAQKQLRTLPLNPFEALRRIEAVRDALKGAGVETVESINAILPRIEAECVRLEAEFWGLLTEACATAGWDVLGNTKRRLVNKTVFVSQEGRIVKVEGVTAPCTPFVPSLIAVLSGQMQDLGGSEIELRSFLGVITKAYDTIPKSGRECSLEAVYRHCIIELQKPNFWRNPKPTSFVGLSRPSFRYRLSEILRLGLSSTDRRRLSLGTTTMAKDS